MHEKPIILNLKNKKHHQLFRKFIKQGYKLIDIFDEQMKELNELKNIQKPNYFLKSEDRFICFPWRKTIIRTLNKDSYRRVRLSRNMGLISESEQKRYLEAKVGIAGLNVGFYGAICLALEGGCSYMKLADFDVLSLSNMNRFIGSIFDIGTTKLTLAARTIYEIDPYYSLISFEKGLNPQNIDNFLLKPKIDILIEEMDNLYLKVLLREKAKKYKIPVVMVTGNESGLILDVEMYNKENIPILNGFLNQKIIRKIKFSNFKNLPFEEKVLLARDFIGSQFLTEKMQKAFLEIGKSLVAIPQLAETSFLRGAILAYIVRKIVLEENVQSGRYIIDLNFMRKI